MSLAKRLLVSWLLCLAASPLTAPFSTCDIFDLLGNGPAPAAVAVKAPKAHDGVAIVFPSFQLAIELSYPPVTAGRQPIARPHAGHISPPLRL